MILNFKDFKFKKRPKSQFFTELLNLYNAHNVWTHSALKTLKHCTMGSNPEIMSQCGNEPLMPRLGLRLGLRHLRWNDDGNFISGNTFYRSIAYNNKLTIITFARVTYTTIMITVVIFKAFKQK